LIFNEEHVDTSFDLTSTLHDDNGWCMLDTSQT
jgi:hypothetical protein